MMPNKGAVKTPKKPAGVNLLRQARRIVRNYDEDAASRPQSLCVTASGKCGNCGKWQEYKFKGLALEDDEDDESFVQDDESPIAEAKASPVKRKRATESAKKKTETTKEVEDEIGWTLKIGKVICALAYLSLVAGVIGISNSKKLKLYDETKGETFSLLLELTLIIVYYPTIYKRIIPRSTCWSIVVLLFSIVWVVVLIFRYVRFMLLI